jgi:hypothetical protein
MRPTGIAMAGAIVLTFALAGQAVAQEQTYETPLYTTPTQPSLDKNYGLPTFGMQGSELPQQKTMATKPATPAEEPATAGDFVKGAPDLTPPRAVAGETGMETPRYTTSYGTTGTSTSFGTTGDTTTFGTGTKFGTDAMETEQGR